MKIIKGFQNMGTDVKLLSAAWKLYGTSCISSFTPPPCSCSRKQKHSVLIYPCACGIYIPFKPITFQELRSYLTSNPYISFRFHFMYTPQHRTTSVVSFLSIPQAPFIQSVTTQAIFLSISSGMFLFSTAS
ncbi:MAG: hypothetical protein JZU53_15785 [Paludibacter sp.]|nr:hypothetical protein [Paludibacter sp.]